MKTTKFWNEHAVNTVNEKLRKVVTDYGWEQNHKASMEFYLKWVEMFFYNYELIKKLLETRIIRKHFFGS